MEPSFWPLPLSLFISSISFLIGSHVAQALLTFLSSCRGLFRMCGASWVEEVRDRGSVERATVGEEFDCPEKQHFSVIKK